MTRIERLQYYRRVLGEAADKSPEHLRVARAKLGRTDLFFLLVFLLGRKDVNRDWLYDRCNEVQKEPDEHLDLWAREHYKSTLITYGKTIQDIFVDPEVTVGIFSHTRPIAKGFLRQIKREFESNDLLKEVYPEILWGNPRAEAPKWNEDDGIVVKRKGNPKESTIEAWGVVDGQPTSKHFALLVYDDLVTRESVNTPEMISKTTDALALSYNLGTSGGARRFIGTRYHFNDSYGEIIRRGTVTPRVYAATKDGTVEGESVFLPREVLDKKYADMRSFVFSAQMLQNPVADEAQGFKADWLRYYDGEQSDGGGMNKYLLCDPASAKKKESDYTAIGVVGLGPDNNYYLLDLVRDRLNLRERGDAIFSLHRRWKPKGVGYEKYGIQADIEYLQDRMGRENYRFDITPLGGQVAKSDRIKGLIPIFEDGRFYLPESMWKTDYQGKAVDLVTAFIEEEYKPFPVGLHDDMFDMIARIMDGDMNTVWPKPREAADRYAKTRKRRARSGSWMTA